MPWPKTAKAREEAFERAQKLEQAETVKDKIYQQRFSLARLKNALHLAQHGRGWHYEVGEVEDKSLEELLSELTSTQRQLGDSESRALDEAERARETWLQRVRFTLDEMHQLPLDAQSLTLAAFKELLKKSARISEMFDNIDNWDKVLALLGHKYDLLADWRDTQAEISGLQGKAFRNVKLSGVRKELHLILHTEALEHVLPDAVRSAASILLPSSEKTVLVHHPQVSLGNVEKAALEVADETHIYLIPVLALSLPAWEGSKSAADASDLDDADIETIVTLFGGQAYQTLSDAREGAIALR